MSIEVQRAPFIMLMMEAVFEEREQEKVFESLSDHLSIQEKVGKMPERAQLSASQNQSLATKERPFLSTAKKGHTFAPHPHSRVQKESTLSLLKKATASPKHSIRYPIKQGVQKQKHIPSYFPSRTHTYNFSTKSTISSAAKNTENRKQEYVKEKSVQQQGYVEKRVLQGKRIYRFFTRLPTHLMPTKLSPTLSSLRGAEKERTEHAPLQLNRWKHEETLHWWTTKRRQQEDRHGQHQHKEEEPKKHQEENSKRVKGVDAKVCDSSGKSHKESAGAWRKPRLSSPKLGIYALYHILTKMGILSESSSTFSYKNEIAEIDRENTETHQKRLEEIEKSINRERSVRRWGVAFKVFSWIGSLTGIFTGIAMCLSGAGAVGGSMLIVAGVITIANQMMEVTGGWDKIAELLPNDDPHKKRAVISWIQIGITVLCLILSGIGIIWGGVSNFTQSMRNIISPFAALGMLGHGVASIGEGITSFMYFNSLSEIHKYDLKLEKLKYRRQDVMERMDGGVDRLKQLFESLARVLGFYREIFMADQKINRG